MGSYFQKWMEQLREGDKSAANKLWSEYVLQLIEVARETLGRTSRRAVDEEDIAVAAFASFCRGVELGRFAKLDDEHDLWQILLMITQRKAIDQRRRERAAKRGGGTVRGGSAVRQKPTGESRPEEWDQFPSVEPTPEFAAQTAEEFRQLLELLNDGGLRALALDKMQGYENEELAVKHEISLRTVERRLNLIRRIWSERQDLPS